MNTWVGPVLALLGVVLATGAGYYQWRRTSKNRRQAAYHKRRAEILEALLAKLGELQLVSRRGTITPDELQAQARKLNEFLIEHGTVLSDEDKVQARHYLQALVDIHASLDSAPVFKDETWAATLAEPTPETPGSAWATSVPASFQRLTSAERYLQEQIRRSWQFQNT